MQSWTLTTASRVSADGTVIVGVGRNPSGQWEAFRATLPVPGVQRGQRGLGRDPPDDHAAGREVDLAAMERGRHREDGEWRFVQTRASIAVPNDEIAWVLPG